MSFVFQTQTFPPGDEPTITAAFFASVDGAHRIHGPGTNNGTLTTARGRGLQLHTDPVLPTAGEAEAWLRARYGNPQASAGGVRFIPATEAPLQPSPRLIDCRQRVESLQRDLAAIPARMIARARAAKSKTRGCVCCHSAVAVGQIGLQPMRPGYSAIGCPVCGCPDFLETKGDRRRQENLRQRLREALASEGLEVAALEVARLRAVPADRCCWMVGVACPT
jgi:hypothetical protein